MTVTARHLTLVACALMTLWLATSAGARSGDGTRRAGLARYYTTPRLGPDGLDPLPPAAPFRSGEAASEAAPTNQWYSSPVFLRPSYPIHALPMTYRATAAGFELGLPSRELGRADSGRRELRYAHVAALVVAPGARVARAPTLAAHSDFSATFRYEGARGESLEVTVLHGSPFSYYVQGAGDVHLHLAAPAAVISDPRAPGGDPRVAAFTIAGHAYAVYAPRGSSWDWSQRGELVLRLPAARRYFSIAGLPDASRATVGAFEAFAYAFPVTTRVTPSVDVANARVRTTYRIETIAKEGRNRTTLMGLYPHHWSALHPSPPSAYGYDTVRGRLKLIAANSFTTVQTYHGFVPHWARLEEPAHRALVDATLGRGAADSTARYLADDRGTYWVGKGLGALAQLAAIAEVEQQGTLAASLRAQLETLMQSWFDGAHRAYFLEDRRLGTFVGYPEEYNSVTAMNDHHFHYGYWITAAAHVALRDPRWADAAHWGPLVDKLVADIATGERGRRDYPYLRNFDPYEGHSWASGLAGLEDGNNQESSSEAVNAWAGLILWAEATGNTRLRDLGIYLYTSEIGAIRTYWFDAQHEVLDAGYGKPYASLLFGGKYCYGTWWTDEPRQIAGINVLPVTPASTYLGLDPGPIRAVLGALGAEERRYAALGHGDGTPADVWQDVLSEYRALADPDAALKDWNPQGSVEFGETRAHTLYWLLSLKEMGRPDGSVTADTPLYAVFRDGSGRRTYLAYNARRTPLHVTFSTGRTLDVPARSLARAH